MVVGTTESEPYLYEKTPTKVVEESILKLLFQDKTYKK